MKPPKALPAKEPKPSNPILDCSLVTTYGKDKDGKEFEFSYMACNWIALGSDVL